MFSRSSYWQPGFLALSGIITAGFIWLGLPVWFALCFGVVSYSLAAATSTGTEFSNDRSQMREYYEFFGVKFGSWQRLPPVVGVTIKYFSEISTHTNRRAWNTNEEEKIEEIAVLLSLQNSPTGLVIARFACSDLTSARELAQGMAARFGVPMREYLAPSRSQRR